MDIEDLHKDLPERLPTEISDQMQFFLRSNADQQMRFIIILGKRVDFDILKKALRLAIYVEPIFSYFYKEEIKKAYWQKQDEIDASLLIDLIETDADMNIEINRFITIEISPFEFPIVRVRVVRKGEKDSICINMNHTPTDGTGLKLFVKILASLYTNLISNPEYCVKSNINGDRSINQVTNHFSFIQKAGFIKQGLKSPKKVQFWSFDWNKTDADNQKIFITTKITRDSFDRIKEYGKSKGATVNDVVLAAFIRTFIQTNNINDNAEKPIIVPIDLRKYIDPTHNTAICSLTSSLRCNIGREIGTSFNETLLMVRDEMTFKKQLHAEMNILSPILLLSRFMTYNKLKEKFMTFKMAPIPLVTNVGIINPSDINFDNIPIEYSFMTGAICYGDYFCMAYSTFQKEITLSIGFIGGVIQIQKVKDFLNNIKTELENIQ